jgi:hypothetical protein
MTLPTLKADTRVRAGVLGVSCHTAGPADGVPLLAHAGCKVVVPYLHGFAETRFLDPATLRPGEQAVLGVDLLALLDALRITGARERRASCPVVATNRRRQRPAPLRTPCWRWFAAETF